MNLNTENKQNQSPRAANLPDGQGTSSGRAQRKSSELSPSELRGIVIEILG
ncbi:MAG: hypothetical protein H6917_05520 [Novosphingobium sp.]|nr:hypothetical protein [Novosphingobium sp.]MCP5401828.1 hypothetical protein [Novosphingobium sp.]